MSFSNANIRVGAVRTIGNIRIQLPNSSPSAQLPINLKNMNGDIPTVEQLRNVDPAAKTGEEVLIYNANTGLWEERQLTLDDVGASGIDGGSF